MDNKGVSVIVPVFNTKAQLRKCIDSILAQDYPEFEIILVDDGSSDGSEAICDEYERKYSNVHTIHQDNRGAAIARLNGSCIASNSMIMFVDSDDYVGSILMSVLANKMVSDNSDLVCSHLVYEADNKQTKNNPYGREGVFYKNEIVNGLIDSEYKDAVRIEVSMCGKMFVKDKLIKALSGLETDLSYGEDLEELLLYIKETEKVTLVQMWEYFYVQRSGSTSQNITLAFFEKLSGLYDFFHNSDDFSNEEILVKQSDYFIRSLLIETITALFPTIEFGYLSYVPPYEIIPQGCRLVVYGAGRVGRSMMRCLLNSNYVKMVLWVDSSVRNSLYGMDIRSPEEIETVEADYILIAVAVEEYAKQIQSFLLEKGIPSDKILWKRPFGG